MNTSIIDQALDAAGLAVLVLDDAGRILDCSDSAMRLLKLGRDEIVGHSLSALLPTDETTGSGITGSGAWRHGAIGRTLEPKPIPQASLAYETVRWKSQDGTARATVVLRATTKTPVQERSIARSLIQSDNAIRGARIGVFEFDLASQTVMVSDIWRQMLELGRREELDLQAEWRSRVHPDDLAAALEPIRLCGEGSVGRASCEYRFRSRDGSRWLWMRTDIAVAERDDDGRPSVLVGAQTDVTERKKIEEALRINLERLQAYFHNAPIGKALVSLEGRFQRVNPALCRLLGYTEPDLLATDFQTLTHPDDLEADLELLRQLLSGAIPHYTLEKRYYRSNGAIMWGRLSVGLVRNAAGQPDHFVSQIVDITEQQRLDELRSDFVSVVSHEL